MCLQEIDDYHDYWGAQLTAMGYDSVFAVHPSKRCDPDQLHHGLAIAFKKELFQIFRMHEIDLNDMVQSIADPNLAAKSRQDNVALLVQLQPWEQSCLPSALCVVTTQLASGNGESLEVVRVLQAEFLCREVAQLNAVAQLPIILAGTFNALPSSDVYHVIRTGRRRPRPRAPAEMERPVADDATPTAVRLTWKAPVSGDARIVGYMIAVKNCMSATLGFNMHELEIEGDETIVEHWVTMLSAGIPYQFRIAARNQFGYGPFSQPSLPVTTPKSNKPEARDKIKGAADEVELPLYADDDIPPQVQPYTPTFGSGRTPRLENGAYNGAVAPRKLLNQNERFPTLHPRGDRDEELVHNEQFDSAYAQYQGFISEPEFTYSSPNCTGTIDYIFYSTDQFEPFQLLSMPTIEEVDALGVDRRVEAVALDKEWFKHKPPDWNDTTGVTKNDDCTYMGEWKRPLIPNAFLQHNPWLPNRIYPSDHLALACVLAIKRDNLAIQWN